ncbi:MAG: hypothetical protein AAGU03_05185 [Anaerolineaceae bacterium]
MRFVIPAKKQPKVFDAIKAGYDTVSGNVYLLLFPIVLDLFFLFGKRLLVANQLERMISDVTLPTSTTTEVIKTWEELSTTFLELFKNFSLTAFLRSFPIGIPSLLAYRPLEFHPLGAFSTVQVESYGSSILYILAFSLLGFLLGALFLSVIRNSVQKNNSMTNGVQLLRQTLSLFTLPVLALLFSIFILTPALFLISIINSILPILGSLGYFLLSLGLISAAIPLFFTAHEILLSGSNFATAARDSIRTVRPTNGKTSIFLMLAILTTYATNFLWQIPKQDSWMLIVSILGHALVTTILYVASFHYYIDAHNCVRESLISETPVNEQTGI